jgi:hypothetical protein
MCRPCHVQSVPEAGISPIVKVALIGKPENLIYFTGRRMLARSVPATVFPVNPPSLAALL